MADDESIFSHAESAHEELEDASDEELVRLVYAYDADEEHLSDLSAVTSRAMATFALKERGYVLEGGPGETQIYDPDGEYVSFTEISE